MSPSSEQIFFTLKQILRSKKVSYRDLGYSLKLTEAGVKKMFLARDCTVSRMAQICDAIGISTADLFESFLKLPIREMNLSLSQSEFFVKNPNYFNFYQKLSFERFSISDLSKAYRLTDKSVRKYLTKLEEFGLLEIHPNERVKLQTPRLAKVRINNPKLSQIRHESIATFIKGIKPTSENNSLGTIHFKFKHTTCKKFQADLQELVERYFMQSEVEQNTSEARDLEVLNIVLGYGQHSLIGDIPNIA